MATLSHRSTWPRSATEKGKSWPIRKQDHRLKKVKLVQLVKKVPWVHQRGSPHRCSSTSTDGSRTERGDAKKPRNSAVPKSKKGIGSKNEIGVIVRSGTMVIGGVLSSGTAGTGACGCFLLMTALSAMSDRMAFTWLRGIALVINQVKTVDRAAQGECRSTIG